MKRPLAHIAPLPGVALFPGHRAGASLKQLGRRPVVGDAAASSPATEPGPH